MLNNLFINSWKNFCGAVQRETKTNKHTEGAGGGKSRDETTTQRRRTVSCGTDRETEKASVVSRDRR